MKKLFLAANLAFYCLNFSTLAIPAHFQTAIDKATDAPTKVTFHGVKKLPDHEIYTIIQGIKTPIKENSERTFITDSIPFPSEFRLSGTDKKTLYYFLENLQQILLSDIRQVPFNSMMKPKQF